MRYDRSVAISKRHEEILLLVKSGTYSSEALAEKLGVSIPTIYRDVLFLKRQGYPLVSVKLSSKWAYQFGSNDESDDAQVKRQLR